MSMEIEKKIADEIMNTVQRLRLPLIIDNLTEGKGDCFPLAVIAQCRRPEIFSRLDVQVQNIINQNNPTLLRHEVKGFIMNCQHVRVKEFQKNYEDLVSIIDNRKWSEYWDIMEREYEWVDQIFVQATAWFIKNDILIVTTTSTEKSPYIKISGNISNEDIRCQGFPLLIGCKGNVHYHSILPAYHSSGKEFIVNMQKDKSYVDSNVVCSKSEVNIQLEDNCNDTAFEYIDGISKAIQFKIFPDKRVCCPLCKKIFKNIIAHLKNGACPLYYVNDLSLKFQKFSMHYFGDKHRES